MAVTANYSRIDKYIVRAQLRQPLHVGGASQGNGEVLVDPLDGKPFIQASGIAGVFRRCYEYCFADQQGAMDLFGSGDQLAGRIRITDGRFLEGQSGIRTELRPRIRINPVTGTSASARGAGSDAVSGQKFETEYIGAGAEIEFRVYVYGGQETVEKNGENNDPESLSAMIPEKVMMTEQDRMESVFALIHAGQVQFGGQKSNGCGSMEILELLHHRFDMHTREGRNDWVLEGPQDNLAYQDRVPHLKELLQHSGFSPRTYSITLQGRTEGSLLVKAIALTGEQTAKFAEKGEKEPDYINMMNAGGMYIIPGSSVKGAVRAQIERIAGYLENTHEMRKSPTREPKNNEGGFDKKQLLNELFGRVGKKKDTGSAGNVRFYDVLVGKVPEHAQEVISNRIHIDRFTGGVMNTGLFREQAVYGSLQIKAAVMNRGSGREASPEADRACGILVLALRDLALGMYNLGSGYSIGRGFLLADSLTVRRADGAEAVITFWRDSRPEGEDPGVSSGVEPDACSPVRMRLQDPYRILDQCLRALWNMQSGDNVSGTSGAFPGKEEA